MFSYWERDYLIPQPCDVAIIGGGFTGLSAGLTLKKYRPSWSVVVLESEASGTLASSRNAGFLCLGSPTELLRDISNYGQPMVEQLLQEKIIGAKILLNYLKKTRSIYCKSHAYEFFSSEFSPPEGLEERLNELNTMVQNAGGPSPYFTKIPNAPTGWKPTFTRPEWVRMTWEGQVHPAAAIAQLRLQFQNLGGILSTHHRVEALEVVNSGVCLHSREATFPARQVLVASNAFAAQLIPELSIEAHRAQVLITEPLGKMPFRGNVHFREGYMYCRDVGQRLLIGGGRFLDFQGEKTHQPGITDTIQAYLLSQLARLTGMEESEIEVADRWSGIMGFTPGRLQPLVELREQGSVAVAAGMNGMGTALGPYLGKKAAEMLISAREGRKVQLPVRGYLPFHSKKDLDRAKRGKEREKQEKERENQGKKREKQGKEREKREKEREKQEKEWEKQGEKRERVP